MTEIHLETVIDAPLQRCFDLARSIDFHIASAQHTQEKAIAGKTNGLIELGESVTWQARHFGILQQLQVHIVAMSPPFYFRDDMLAGAFKSMQHHHYFHTLPTGKTQMIDIFRYETPFGFIGKLFDAVILKRYMTNFLCLRNAKLKKEAEQDNI